MKKSYLVSLDEKETVELKEWLERQGLSFSGYINSLIHQQLVVVKDLGIPLDVDKVTLGQFIGLAQKMWVNLSAEARAKKA